MSQIPFVHSIRRVALAAAVVLVGGATAWALGALWFDLHGPIFRHSWLLIYLAALVIFFWFIRGAWYRLGVLFGGFVFVLAIWLDLKPSNDRAWQPDLAQMPWAEIEGDHVTLHNVRNCDYRTETDYTPMWQTRSVDLKQLRGVDLALNYWGSAWMAHPIISFQFADAAPVCFSIETRKEIGESYSAVGGLYRQFELVYICADERDLVRVRTNFRHGEDVYLYRTKATPEMARQRFLEYIAAMNSLREHPRWYNAATTNCTTTIRTQRATADRAPWDWRILFNGYADEMLFEHKAIETGDLGFSALKAQARINDAARAANESPDFSNLIRQQRAGFTSQISSP